ncbi:hypothetical protein [Deinococcus sp. QL22]|nr:hypothetical protein [Deinococcus sp. QL22]UQN10214.1 hypothetical protein M1R55_27955 [Deinococcus sp. QL22]
MPTPIALMDQAAQALKPFLKELALVGGPTLRSLLISQSAKAPFGFLAP